LKLHHLTEKYLLKKVAKQWLPEEIWQRPKRPYRAPIQRSFFNHSKLDYVLELLSPSQIQKCGIFKPGAVDQLTIKAKGESALSETDEMALVGIISTQLVYNQFVDDFNKPKPLDETDDIKIIQKSTINQNEFPGVK
jgi:asparagine synthase (glutamine-hydrolysing)